MRAETTLAKCRPPILIDGLLDDPDLIRSLIEQHAPYWPVQRYFAGDAEYRSSSGQGRKMIIAPNFRGDWAYDEPLVPGAELFLDHPALREAASKLFDTPHVRPQIVYTNLTWQLPFHQGAGHTDVPAFRGVDRKRYPIWLLTTMGRSGLFEDERINIATAVAWFYRGEGGGFEYWPDGPTEPLRVHEGNVFNTAIVGDNDRMFHRVRPVGRREDGLLPGMTLDTRLEHADGEWRIVEDGETRASFPFEKLRISVSWKAQVFRDEAERRRVDEHSDDIDFAEVLARFHRDLEQRGMAHPPVEDPLTDAGFIDRLSTAYVRDPVVS
jgi:hypothetical protein